MLQATRSTAKRKIQVCITETKTMESSICTRLYQGCVQLHRNATTLLPACTTLTLIKACHVSCRYIQEASRIITFWRQVSIEMMMSRAIDWYINESILRGSGGGPGGVRELGGGSLKIYWATFTKYKYILESLAQAQSIGTLVG